VTGLRLVRRRWWARVRMSQADRRAPPLRGNNACGSHDARWLLTGGPYACLLNEEMHGGLT